MILEIKKYPDPILRKKCQEVTEITPEIIDLSQNMIKTLVVNQGVGLAAPQVGELKRIIVVKYPEDKLAMNPTVFINPEIMEKTKETQVEEEGCLSFPALFLKIKRAKGVKIKALNLEGKEVLIKAEGFVARIFQHEIDHLNGILFFDRLSFWRKLKLSKRGDIKKK